MAVFEIIKSGTYETGSLLDDYRQLFFRNPKVTDPVWAGSEPMWILVCCKAGYDKEYVRLISDYSHVLKECDKAKSFFDINLRTEWMCSVCGTIFPGTPHSGYYRPCINCGQSAGPRSLVENMFMRQEIKRLKEDLESGFMDGTYARLKELQDKERKYDEIVKTLNQALDWKDRISH